MPDSMWHALPVQVQGTKETLQAQLTLPANYLDIDKVCKVKVISATTWKIT